MDGGTIAGIVIGVDLGVAALISIGICCTFESRSPCDEGICMVSVMLTPWWPCCFPCMIKWCVDEGGCDRFTKRGAPHVEKEMSRETT